jgi:hypothetical protein
MGSFGRNWPGFGRPGARCSAIPCPIRPVLPIVADAAAGTVGQRGVPPFGKQPAGFGPGYIPGKTAAQAHRRRHRARPPLREADEMSNNQYELSIDELAALFEQRAKAARDQIKSKTPNMRIALLREQARTWEEAATIVRGSIIVTKGKPKR